MPAASLEAQARVVRRVTWIGLVANVLLSGVKFAAGVLGSSQAVVADAVHSLSDCATDIAILIGVRYWSAPPDSCHPYGHRRIETLITVFIGLALGGVAVALGYEATCGLLAGEVRRPEPIALGAALLSVAVKEVLYHWTRAAGRRAGSPALVANAWHHRTDALSSIPVALAVGAAWYDPSLAFLDGVGTVVVAGFILFAAWRIITPGLGELTDRGAAKQDVAAITALAGGMDGVREVHAVRTRRSGLGLLVDLHVLVDPKLTVCEGHDIASAVKRALLERGPGVLDVVVHIEPFGG